MKVEVPYGHGSVALNIPEENILEIIRVEDPRSSEDEQKIILDALRNPIASKPLLQLA